MSKSQVVWLIIRLAGVCCALVLLTTFFSLVGSIPALFTLPKIDVPNKNANVSTITPTMTPRPMPPGFGDPNMSPNGMPNAAPTPASNDKSGESITDKFKGENFTHFLYNLVMTAIFAFLTWYLLRDGRILFSVLMREEPLGLKASKEPEVTSLNLGEEKPSEPEE